MEVCNIFVLFYILTGWRVHYSNQFQIQRKSPHANNSTHGITRRQIPQGAVKTVPDYIRQYGYPAEVHEVTTADGYILTMIRIPFGRNKNAPKRKPILFHHGLISDSSVWILNDPDKILALQLADLGYDIWLANARGTRYSRRHVKYTDKDKAFFDYSIDDIGKYDIPAEIDYIIEYTGAAKIQYIGHSMGGLVFHMAMHNFPEYNNKISLMTGVAPAVYTKHLTGIVRLLLGFGPIADIGVGVIGYGAGEFPSPFLSHLLQLVGFSACSWRPLAITICSFVTNIAAGYSHPNSNNYAQYLSTHLSPSSVKVIRHFVQMIKSGNFEHYDYGKTKNLEVYGTKKPPLYFLKATAAPVGIFYGKTDSLVPPKDILRLASELPNNVYLRAINKNGNHADFFIAKDNNELFNRYAVDLMTRY